jgi:hypothetical protein
MNSGIKTKEKNRMKRGRNKNTTNKEIEKRQRIQEL